MSNILSKVKPARFIVPAVVIVGTIVALVNSGGDRPTNVNEASAPSDTAQKVLDELAAIREENQVLKAQMQQSQPDAVEILSRDRALSVLGSRFDSFDNATYDTWRSSIRNMASIIYMEAVEQSQASGRPIELILHRRLVGLQDRSYALATQHSGLIDFNNQEMVDTLAGQTLEQMAIAHIMNQQTHGQPPVAATTDISEVHLAIEGLSRGLFELQAQGLKLTDQFNAELNDAMDAQNETLGGANGELASTE